MNVYADSSFLVSLYVVDSHLAEARKMLTQKPQVWLTPLNRSEIAHSLYFQVFRQRIRVVEAQFGWEAFEDDCSRGLWRQVPIPNRAWDVSISLAAKYGATLGISTLDLLLVACALELKAQKLWTFDYRQAKLAEAVGLDSSA